MGRGAGGVPKQCLPPNWELKNGHHPLLKLGHLCVRGSCVRLSCASAPGARGPARRMFAAALASTKSHDGKVKTVVTGHTGSTYRDRETPRPRDATPAPARTEPGLTGQVHRGTRTLKDAHGARTHDIQRGQARRPCPSVACAHARALRCTLRPTITTPLAHAPSLSLACSCASVIARDGA